MIIILKTILGYVLSCWLLINEKWFLTASLREQITSYDDMCFVQPNMFGFFFLQDKANVIKIKLDMSLHSSTLIWLRDYTF
jgi:hypothetical protein